MMLSLAGWWRLVWPRPREEAAGRGTPLAAARAAADTAPAQVVAEIARGREQVAARVEALRSFTEREILACGNVLSTIVDDVRELIGETERTVAATRARSTETTSRFIGEVQQDMHAQETAVDEVLVLTNGIEESIKAIDGLSQFSNILAINARIEAARLGDSGRGFAVIAEQMRELSKTIQNTAGKVTSTIDAVRTGLPQVRERALSMQGRTRSFIDAVSAQVNSGSLQTGSATGEGRLDAVIRLSNEALSHLQIQDALAQQLDSIDRDFGTVEGRVRRVLDGEVLAEIEPEEPVGGGDGPAPGKVTLF
jgi:methyl-accepting chemotaxis protein